MARILRPVLVAVLMVAACVVFSGPSSGQVGCHPSYPGQCIPAPPPNLNCDSPQVQFSNFPVLPPDPHGLDGNDNDGLGCETSTKPRFVATTTVSTSPPTTSTTSPAPAPVNQTRIISITDAPAPAIAPGFLDRTG